MVRARVKRATFVTQLALENVKSFLGSHVLDLTNGKGREPVPVV
jgi:hypothetical protein